MLSNFRFSYSSLKMKKPDDQEEPFLGQSTSRLSDQQRLVHRGRLIVFQWIIILMFTIFFAISWSDIRSCEKSRLFPPGQIFSPAQSAVSYKNIVYEAGFPPFLNKYQGGPSPETNKAWEDLYQFGINRIPMSEAAKLVNKTRPIPNDPGQYAVALDVFHQLHCLNKIRLHSWTVFRPDTEENLMTEEHFEHCLDSVRQSIMCSADISPITWSWSKKENKALAEARTIHTCRDFEKIQQWGQEHHVLHFNRSIYIDDPLEHM